MHKSIFISFDYDNDARYKNMLLAWNANREFDFSFYDGSLRTAIDSNDAQYIKAIIRPKIVSASHLLCLVGKRAWTSSWIDWEIKTAIEAGKQLIAVKIERDNQTPARLLGAGAAWALSFNFEAIKQVAG